MTRRLRLISGLILLTFVVTHFLNHSLGLVSLDSLPYRLASFAANRDALLGKIEGLPGVKSARNYPKATGVELYGGIRFLYDSEALGGLPAAKFAEAMQAEV